METKSARIDDDIDLIRVIAWFWALRYFALVGTVLGLIIAAATLVISRTQTHSIVKSEISRLNTDLVSQRQSIAELKSLFQQIERYQASGFLSDAESVVLKNINQKISSGHITIDMIEPDKFLFQTRGSANTEGQIHSISVTAAVNRLVKAQEDDFAQRAELEREVFGKVMNSKVELAKILRQAASLMKAPLPSGQVNLVMEDFASLIFASIPESDQQRKVLLRLYIEKAAECEALQRELFDLRKLPFLKKIIPLTTVTESVDNVAPSSPPLAGILAIGLIFGMATGLFFGSFLRYSKLHLPRLKHQLQTILSSNSISSKSDYERDSSGRKL